jgi:hypothetical protein
MAVTEIQLSAMLGIEVDRNAHSLRLQARDAHQNIYQINLPESMLGGLIVGLRSQINRLRGSAVGQPMTLDSGQAFTLPDGRVGLELMLDNAVRLPVIFPKEAIAVLRKSLDELERLSGGSSGPTRPH